MVGEVAAPLMTVPDLTHCQVSPETLPSGSLSAAVRTRPSSGCDDDRVTVPGSSTLATLMVTQGCVASARRCPPPGP